MHYYFLMFFSSAHQHGRALERALKQDFGGQLSFEHVPWAARNTFKQHQNSFFERAAKTFAQKDFSCNISTYSGKTPLIFGCGLSSRIEAFSVEYDAAKQVPLLEGSRTMMNLTWWLIEIDLEQKTRNWTLYYLYGLFVSMSFLCPFRRIRKGLHQGKLRVSETLQRRHLA